MRAVMSVESLAEAASKLPGPLKALLLELHGFWLASALRVETTMM